MENVYNNKNIRDGGRTKEEDMCALEEANITLQKIGSSLRTKCQNKSGVT